MTQQVKAQLAFGPHATQTLLQVQPILGYFTQVSVFLE